MTDYVIDGLWLSAEKAVQDRSVDGLLDVVQELKKREPKAVVGDDTPAESPKKNPKIKRGTTRAMLDLLHEHNSMERFLRSNSVNLSGFTPHSFVLWLKQQPYVTDLDAIDEHWSLNISKLFNSYYCDPKKDVYAGIQWAGERGVYRLAVPYSTNGHRPQLPINLG